MGVTRLKRKDRKNKARANNKINRVKQLNAMPVIRNIDIEAIKASFGTVSKKKAAPKVEKEVVAEPAMAEVVEQVEAPVAVEEPQKVNEPAAEEAAPVEAKETPAPVEEKKEAKKEENKEEALKAEEKKEDKKEAPAKDQDARVKDLLGSIGTATEADKNDLKKINGIGPKYESFLNEVGIYTYLQVSKLKASDLDNLAEFSGLTREKIEKEDWMKQAKDLLKG